MTWNDHVRAIDIVLHPQIGTLISRKCRYGWFLVTLGEWCLLPDIFKDWSEALGSLCHDCCTISSTLGFDCSRKYPFPNPFWSLKSFYGRKFFRLFQVANYIGYVFCCLNHPCCVGNPYFHHPWAGPTMISSAISSTASWERGGKASFWRPEHGQEEHRVFQVNNKSGLFIFPFRKLETFFFLGMIFFCYLYTVWSRLAGIWDLRNTRYAMKSQG